MRQPKVILFIDGPVPTPYDKQEANELRGQGATVVFRNARIEADQGAGAPEACDGVAGAVPDTYKGVKSAEEAVAAYKQRIADDAKALEATGAELAKGGATVAAPNKGAATGWV